MTQKISYGNAYICTALLGTLAVSMIFLAPAAPSAEARRISSYAYAKVFVETSSVDGIVAGDRVYFAWESGKPLRINVADVNDVVTTASLTNVKVSKSDSTLDIRAAVTDSGIAGLRAGDLLACSFDLVAETADCANQTSGGSISGHSVYVNALISTKNR